MNNKRIILVYRTSLDNKAKKMYFFPIKVNKDLFTQNATTTYLVNDPIFFAINLVLLLF